MAEEGEGVPQGQQPEQPQTELRRLPVDPNEPPTMDSDVVFKDVPVGEPDLRSGTMAPHAPASETSGEGIPDGTGFDSWPKTLNSKDQRYSYSPEQRDELQKAAAEHIRRGLKLHKEMSGQDPKSGDSFFTDEDIDWIKRVSENPQSQEPNRFFTDDEIKWIREQSERAVEDAGQMEPIKLFSEVEIRLLREGETPPTIKEMMSREMTKGALEGGMDAAKKVLEDTIRALHEQNVFGRSEGLEKNFQLPNIPEGEDLNKENPESGNADRTNQIQQELSNMQTDTDASPDTQPPTTQNT